MTRSGLANDAWELEVRDGFLSLILVGVYPEDYRLMACQ